MAENWSAAHENELEKVFTLLQAKHVAAEAKYNKIRQVVFEIRKIRSRKLRRVVTVKEIDPADPKQKRKIDVQKSEEYSAPPLTGLGEEMPLALRLELKKECLKAAKSL